MPDTKTHTPAQTNNRLGIILMILTMLVFASQDGISRYLADQYNVYMIVMVRYWFFAGFVLVFARIRYGSIKTVARSRVPFIQTFRSLLLMIEVCVMVVGFVYLGLIQSYAVFAIYPLLISALSAPILGEFIGWRRWVAILFGFIGVVIILQPGWTVFSPFALIPFISALMFALYSLLTRYVARYDAAITSFFWTGIVGAIGISFVGVFHWQTMAMGDWGWMGVLCLCATLGHYMLIRCYEVAEAGFLQPFTYFQLVFGTSLGIFLFGEILQTPTLIGMIVIVAAGLFTLWRAQKAKED